MSHRTLGHLLTCATLTLTSALSLIACGDAEPNTTERARCADDRGVIYGEGDDAMCVITGAITEEGFSCPVNFMGARVYGQLMICGGPTTIPGGIREDLRRDFPTYAPVEACINTVCGRGNTCATGPCIADPRQEVACTELCGVGCPAPEFQTCASDGNRYCGACQIECKGLTVDETGELCEADGPDIEACVEACGIGCPAPQFQTCGEDGERYCGTCVMACYGVEEADDRSICHTTNPDEDTCIASCGDGCASPDEQPCASDGNRYCSECVIACKNLFVEQDASLCQ